MTDTSGADPAAEAGPRVSVPAPAPSWVAPLYLGAAVALLPWIVYLGVVLPEHTTSAHWDVAWVGFDASIALSLALTAWCAFRGTNWLEAAATASATLLLVDAWFDCTTAHGAANIAQALIQAFLAEIPLAVLSLWIARHAFAVHAMAARWAQRLRG